MNKLVKTLSRVALLIQELRQFSPSCIAATTIYIARQMFGLQNAWPQSLEKLTTFTQESLEDCSLIFLTAMRNINKGGKGKRLYTLFPLLSKRPDFGKAIIDNASIFNTNVIEPSQRVRTAGSNKKAPFVMGR